MGNNIRITMQWPDAASTQSLENNSFSDLASIWIFNKAIDSDVGLITSQPAYQKVKYNLQEDLKRQFRHNLKNVRPVSANTMLRRRAFENLGEAEGHVSSSTRSPYREDIMNRVISDFKVKTEGVTEKSIKLALKTRPSNHHIGQFEGLRTQYRGPDMVGISMTGLNITDHKIQTDDDRKMIIPIMDSGKDVADAVLTRSGEFIMNSKKNQQAYQAATGLPVLFRDKLRSPNNRRHYNPITKDRIVMWGVYNGNPVLTRNVKLTLRKRFFGSK